MRVSIAKLHDKKSPRHSRHHDTTQVKNHSTKEYCKIRLTAYLLARAVLVYSPLFGWATVSRRPLYRVGHTMSNWLATHHVFKGVRLAMDACPPLPLNQNRQRMQGRLR
jgi:hypothetical protein